MTKATKEPARILVVGGGYVGMYTALRLQRRLRAERRQAAQGQGGVRITVLDPDPYMTYQPFLPEAAAGSISPRHVVVPLRRVLSGCQIIIGEAHRIDHARRVAHISTLATSTADERTAGARAGDGPTTVELPYTELVLAPGSVSRVLPVPGLAEHGIGFKTVEEAIGLRNHVLEQLDIASSTRDPAVRDAALTFVFVGGGYAGVEALGELEDMARYACRYYHNVRAEDLRFVLVEASDRILPEVGETMGKYALRELRARNIDVRLGTRLDSCEDRIAVLSDGSRHPTRTLVWTAGVKPHPILAATGLPLNRQGRLKCEATLRVEGVEHVWAGGDAAAVPDLESADRAQSAGDAQQEAGDPPLCAPNAQHAVRQANRLAENLAATLRGGKPVDYRHAYAGSVASLGLHKGVAHVYGRKLKGYPAWFMHRTYHLSRVPTFNRKSRVLAEWVLAGLFKREIVSLGSLEHPRAEFEVAAGGRGTHGRGGGDGNAGATGAGRGPGGD